MRLCVLACVLLLSCGRTQPVQPRTPVPPPVCRLTASVDHLDFGALEPMQERTEFLTLTDEGSGPCTLASLRLLEGSDASFSVTQRPMTLPLELSPGDVVQLSLTFAPREGAPADRLGTFEAQTFEDTPLEVPLSGRVEACQLVVRPASVDFGNVALNTTVTARVNFSNAGARTCLVDSLALAPTTDPHFSLSSAEPRALAPGASSDVVVSFAGTDSSPPHHREGTLTFRSNDLLQPTGAVPLSAFVNTVCTEAGQFIYTVDGDGRFARFDPRTVSYFDIAPLRCPSGSSPFSMNVDQSAIAWVLFADGNIFKVDTADGSCTASGYAPGQQGFTTFGMGSTFDSNTGQDTLYLSGLTSSGLETRLGTLDLTSLRVTFVGTADVTNAELTGTGDGQLWSFSPANGGAIPVLARLDPRTAQVLERYELPTVDSMGGWAVKFFGGAFYLFIGEDIWKVDRSSLDPMHATPTTPPRRVLNSPGRNIVGAGVSTCAPVQE